CAGRLGQAWAWARTWAWACSLRRPGGRGRNVDRRRGNWRGNGVVPLAEDPVVDDNGYVARPVDGELRVASGYLDDRDDVAAPEDVAVVRLHDVACADGAADPLHGIGGVCEARRLDHFRARGEAPIHIGVGAGRPGDGVEEVDLGRDVVAAL